MKKKQASGGHMLYADYVVPVYNLNSDTRHLTAYSNGSMYVDVWAVRATMGKEFESMCDSLQRAEDKSRAALENAPDNEEIRMNEHLNKFVRELFINPKYYNVIDSNLKLVVAKYLREQNLKTDLDHAKYLFGFSYFTCFKEMFR